MTQRTGLMATLCDLSAKWHEAELSEVIGVEAINYNQFGWVLQRHGIQTSKNITNLRRAVSTNLRVGALDNLNHTQFPAKSDSLWANHPAGVLPAWQSQQSDFHCNPRACFDNKDCQVENQKPSGVTHGFSESHMCQPNSGWSHAHKNTRNLTSLDYIGLLKIHIWLLNLHHFTTLFWILQVWFCLRSLPRIMACTGWEGAVAPTDCILCIMGFCAWPIDCGCCSCICLRKMARSIESSMGKHGNGSESWCPWCMAKKVAVMDAHPPIDGLIGMVLAHLLKFLNTSWETWLQNSLCEILGQPRPNNQRTVHMPSSSCCCNCCWCICDICCCGWKCLRDQLTLMTWSEDPRQTEQLPGPSRTNNTDPRRIHHRKF